MRRRKRNHPERLILAALVAALLLGGIAAYILRLHRHYESAAEALESGDYTSAQESFSSLDGFRDSEELARQAAYLAAQELLAAEDYAAARDAFAALGDYLDAPERASACDALARQEAVYLAAQEAALHAQYLQAYRLYESVADFRDAPARMDELADTIYGAVYVHTDAGEYAVALDLIGDLASIGDERAEGLLPELVARESFPLAAAEEGSGEQPLTRFTRGASEEDYAALFIWMFTSGVTEVTLPADAADRVPKDEVDALIARVLAGYDRAEERLPDYGSIYAEAAVKVWDNGAVATRMTVRCNDGSPYDDAALAAHASAFRQYCAAALEEMMATLRIGRSMSDEQKSRAVYDYVTAALDYDAAHSVHDAYVAVQGGLGVCEGYAALYVRMCRMAGVPTDAVIGTAGGDKHIWCVQWDESGAPRCTDPTWGDRDGSQERYFRAEALWSTHVPAHD